MQLKKEDYEAIGRRFCALKGTNPDQQLDDFGGLPNWMCAAMTICDMLLMNEAVRQHLASLPMPAAPPDSPMVFSPYHKAEAN